MTPAKVTTSQIIKRAVSHDVPLSDETALPNLEIDLEDHKQQYEIDTLNQQLQESRDNHNLRMGYANKIFTLVCVWLGCVIASVILAGFHLGGFVLSDKVLITFITTTTVNVLGLFAIVAKWMFQQNGGSNEKKKADKEPKKAGT